MVISLFLVWLAAAPAVPQPQAPRANSAASEADAGYYFLLGRYLEGEGKTAEAIDALKHAGQLQPQSAEPRAELAALYARQDRPQEAIAAAEEALQIDARNREANRVLGSVLAALSENRQSGRSPDQIQQDQARAIEALEIARAGSLPDLSLDLTLSRLYIARNRPADAVPLLRHIVDEQPGYVDGWLLLAAALEASGGTDEAIAALKEVVQDHPTNGRARVQIAELYERERRWSDAADAWKDVQNLNARNVEVVVRRASALLSAGRASEARDVAQQGLKDREDDPRLTYVLAQSQRELGDLDAAEATARQLRSSHPEDVRGTYLLAEILQARNRPQDVIDLLQPEIARLDGASQGGQAALLLDTQGFAYQQLEQHDAAVAAFRKAVDRAPDDPLRHAILIQGLGNAGRFSDALAAAETAKQKFPGNTNILYQAGATLDRAGRRDEAEKAFRDLIARDPRDANALNYLGYMFAEHGTRLDEAVTLIERALEVEPDNPSFLDSLGWAYVQQGKLDLADRPLSTAAEKLPKNSVIQDHLGDLRAKQNRHADAIAAWQRALAGDGESIDRARIEKKIAEAHKQGRR
jgi:tetratricopeptide (TPR) repeat protein